MELKYIGANNSIYIAELIDEQFLISKPQDVLDLFGNLIAANCTRLIIHERNLHADFFNLKTGLAGEILQKFSNYKIKVAIIGDFAKYKSNSLQDFIFESNKTASVSFTGNIKSAIVRLEK
jgi:hypothetical protein